MQLAYLTHRSAIDKELMALIRAGLARRMCPNSWADVLRELHFLRHDLRELAYLKVLKIMPVGKRPIPCIPFSPFGDRNGYAGFTPSRHYIANVYIDFMLRIRPHLDRAMACLTGTILKWDHSFKVCFLLLRLVSY